MPLYVHRQPVLSFSSCFVFRCHLRLFPNGRAVRLFGNNRSSAISPFDIYEAIMINEPGGEHGIL